MMAGSFFNLLPLCHSYFVLHNVHPLGSRMPELCMTYHISTILLMF